MIDNLDSWIPEEYCEIFAIAQHYGVPTRLLDWTFDINIAILFAIVDASRKIKNNKNINLNKEKFSIWLLNYNFLGYYRNKIDCDLRLIIPKYYRNVYITAQKGLFTLEKLVLNENTLHKKEKFESIDKKTLNARIHEQDLTEASNDPFLYKFSFPYTCITQAYNILCDFGYNYSTIFPGLSNIFKSLLFEQFIRERFREENIANFNKRNFK